MDHSKGKKIAILSTNGFEESELFEPKKAMEENGAEVRSTIHCGIFCKLFQAICLVPGPSGSDTIDQGHRVVLSL